MNQELALFSDIEAAHRIISEHESGPMFETTINSPQAVGVVINFTCRQPVANSKYSERTIPTIFSMRGGSGEATNKDTDLAIIKLTELYHIKMILNYNEIRIKAGKEPFAYTSPFSPKEMFMLINDAVNSVIYSLSSDKNMMVAHVFAPDPAPGNYRMACRVSKVYWQDFKSSTRQ